MGPRRRADGTAVKTPEAERPRWLLVRQGPLAPEERAVLAAVQRRLRRQRCELITVLLGTSSYDAELPTSAAEDTGEVWMLEDDARGRGIQRPIGRSGRIVSPEELVAAIMAAEKVIQFP
jgi:hypothetical protein